MDDATKNVYEVVLGILQAGAIIIGALWAYFRFRSEGIHLPRIEFDMECSILGPQQDRYVAAFVLHATNRGNIEHRFSEIRLRVRGSRSDAALRMWKGREPLLEFPEEEFDTVNIIPDKMQYYFVRPGVHQRFSFITSVPGTWRFLLARATFKYQASGDLHTAERVFEVKAGSAKGE